MGAACTKEHAAAEGSRNDSPDPVMYDLMRKSIQATTMKTNGGAADTVPSEPFRRKSNQLAGQHHLLFKNNGSSSLVSAGAAAGGPTKQPRPKSKENQNDNENEKENDAGKNKGKTKSKGKVPKSSSQSPPLAAAGRRAPQSSANGTGKNKAGNSSNSGKSKLTAADFSAVSAALDVTIPQSSSKSTTYPTRLIRRRRSLRGVEEGVGTHIYAIRYPEDTSSSIVSENITPVSSTGRQEQCPPRNRNQQQQQQQQQKDEPNQQQQAVQLQQPLPHNIPSQQYNRKVAKFAHTAYASIPSLPPPIPSSDGDVFTVQAMSAVPRQPVVDWVTVSEEHSIYIADVGMSASQCDHIVATTEQVCRGQYAAYTYAKQTLGCREFPILAQNSFHPVHATVHQILEKLQDNDCQLQLDDREPHIVKYDVTKKERQKLDMHTDKSEWTFLIALSNGCGVDYEGGGTYFECLDATIHIQRGHALIFPGKLRHCGQKITSGLRFLLVGFLVDKTATIANPPSAVATSSTVACAGAATAPGTLLSSHSFDPHLSSAASASATAPANSATPNVMPAKVTSSSSPPLATAPSRVQAVN